MSCVPRRRSLSPAPAITCLLFTVLLAGFLLAPAQPSVRAEGSQDLINNTGNRAYLEYHQTAQTAGIPRQSQFLVYAENGETINLGSSAMNIGAGNIEVVSPDGVVDTTCEAQRLLTGGVLGEYGVITNLAEEVAGPLPTAGGYTPCTFAVTATGIWTVRFTSPNPLNNLNNNPPTRLTTVEWAPQPATSYWISAWDVTVRDGVGAAIQGRTFTTYLAMNMGNNGLRLRANVYILTIDGYIYQVDMNGLDPFGFIFFTNTEGFTDSAGQAAYRSIQFQGTNTIPTLPAIYKLHSPAAEDAFPSNDITHLIFFDQPDPNLPAQAPFYDEQNAAVATTWLRLATPITPLSISNFAFIGIEGTSGRMGTAPLGGNFTFDATKLGGVSIQIDVNGDGDFIDPVDRTFIVPVDFGSNQVYWDGLDGTGAPVTPGPIAFAAQIIDHYGEVHFPFLDAEQNINGISIERIRDAGTTTLGNLDPFLVYYNDTYNYSPTTAYDFTICGTGETPAPPAAAAVAACNGTPPTPRSALAGVNSEVVLPGDITGAHGWASNFGDRRGIDTWVFYPANPVNLALGIQVREADLAIVKSHSPTSPLPGGAIIYTLVVTNNGPSDAEGASVLDTIPSSIGNVTWSCAISTAPGSGACGAASGNGNVISTTLDLDNGAVAVYTVQGTLSASASGTIVNTAEVVRPPDLSDPNPNNNRSTNTLTVSPAADLELDKTFAAPLPTAIGDPLTFQINLRNRGPDTANSVAVTDQLPPEVTYLSSTASRGSYNPATGVWTVGSIAKDEVLTLLINTTLNAVALTNTAQVSSSDKPDPDSTPGNGNPNEDDQGSTSLPIPVADVSLTKVVNTPVVNLGGNAIFTIVLTNDGPSTATGVEVTDRLPIGLSFVSATPSQGSYDSSSGLWQVGTVLDQANASLAIEVTVEGVGPFTNTAEVSDMNEFDIDSSPNNANPSEDDQASAVVGAALADLALSKTINTGVPLVGEVVTYTVTLRNDGPSATTGVAVSEQVPTGLEYISNTVSQGSYDPFTGSWTVGALANGANATLTITGRVLSSPITNLAQVSASNLPDPDSTPGNGNPNEDDQASLTIPSEVDLALTKQLIAAPTPLRLGDQVTFAVQITNQYSTTATGVQVSDRLPSGLEYVSSNVSQGSYDPVSGLWDIGTLPPTASADLIVVARLVATGNLRNVAEISRCDQRDIDSIPNSGAPEADDLQAVSLAVLPAAITLISFDAAYTEGGAVALSWATGIELNTAGFALYRSSDGMRSGALRITPALIAAQGNATGGASYRFVDLTAQPGVGYSYWLREVEAGGVLSEYGPVRPTPSLSAGSQRLYLPMVWR